MRSLAHSIEAFYTAFEDVPKPRTIEGCPCCIESKDICTLLSTPLRDLTPDALSSYASSAFLTVGDEADYLYFLPRIVEISCTDSGWWPDVAVTGRAIAQTRLAEWSSVRRDALMDVLCSVIQDALPDPERAFEIDDWICAISKMGVDVRPYLDQIERSPEAVLAFYEENSQSLNKKKLSNSFWDKGDLGYESVVSWFESPRVSRIILDGYGLEPNSQQDAGGKRD